jgi:hypothetical protein
VWEDKRGKQRCAVQAQVTASRWVLIIYRPTGRGVLCVLWTSRGGWKGLWFEIQVEIANNSIGLWNYHYNEFNVKIKSFFFFCNEPTLNNPFVNLFISASILVRPFFVFAIQNNLFFLFFSYSCSSNLNMSICKYHGLHWLCIALFDYAEGIKPTFHSSTTHWQRRPRNRRDYFQGVKCRLHIVTRRASVCFRK